MPAPPKRHALPPYPWDKKWGSGHPCITKDFFRCRGKSSNPPVMQGERKLYDCSRHGLPWMNGEAGVSEKLLTLLNALQEATGKRVVITTGHRCPTHNTYCDPSPYNRQSKHQMGAEVDFYVEGWEATPMKVVEWVMGYYKDEPKLAHFERYERENLNVRTKPWMNAEILIKLYMPDEGRDKDNEHPYAYISLQDRSIAFDQQLVENYQRTE